MIDAYVFTTPNGFKALIALEELAIPYTIRWIDITKGAQKTPEYLAINPNNKIPAIVDSEGPGGEPLTVFESGAVLTYLGDKTGRLMPQQGADRYIALEWIFFGAGGPGPTFGQLGYWKVFAKDKNAGAEQRAQDETDRLLGVLDRRLAASGYLAGPDYTMADIMNVTWVRALGSFIKMDLAPWPNVTRWLAAIEERPAVQRAFAMKPG
jgi:GST-like protein